ncbi:MAG: AAA family ATPase [Planctomycetota bacterium]|nr:AAA family ATPase [Planctomycetota bacterium]
MLLTLELENFLLFEKTAFAFSPGLNAVSGETGAGKSLVARALGLALGGRGGRDAIRRGCPEAKIRAVFQASPAWPKAASELAGPDGRITVERTLRADGGGLAVNGKARAVQAVRLALGSLVDFAAQNEQTHLADPRRQLELLDSYGGLDGERQAYTATFRSAETLVKRLRAGREERELVRLRLERIRADLRDIEEIHFDPESDPGLEDAIREMANSAAVAGAAAEAAAFLEGGDPPALDSLARARRVLERMAEASPGLGEAGRNLESSLEQARVALSLLAAVSGAVDAGPERLDDLIGRSEKLKALARRLECQVEELPRVAEELARRKEELADWDAGEDEARERLAGLLPELVRQGAGLGERRRLAAGRLAAAVNSEMADLAMSGAGFDVVFEPLWRQGMPLEKALDAGPAGLDEIAFLISPNPGEPAAAIAGGASGGEMSRALFALKAVLAEADRPDIMFFDEIDAGVGARLGGELAAKLKALAARRQVVVITHLPQIAALADRHIRVGKETREGRTLATAERMEGEGREREIASMIHGGRAGEAALRQAREMLSEGGGAGREAE